MILNSAVIERYLIDGNTYEDTKEFIDALLACDDLIADVYVNYKRVASGPLSLSVNNSWIIANVDERMSITNMDGNAYVINIVAHQLGCDELEDIIMKSTSPLSTFIDPGDVDADLYFAVMATVPECTQECHVPESEFNMMGTNNIVPKDFEQCPDDPTIPEPEPGDQWVINNIYYQSVDEDAVLTAVGENLPENATYIWDISGGKESSFEPLTSTGPQLYISGSEHPDYCAELQSNVPAGYMTATVTINEESTDPITILRIEEGTKAYYSIKNNLFRFTVIDALGNIMACDPEYYHEWTIGVGGDKGDYVYIPIQNIENMSELTVEVDRSVEPYISNQDAQQAFDALTDGADGIITEITEYDEGRQYMKTIAYDLQLIKQN